VAGKVLNKISLLSMIVTIAFYYKKAVGYFRGLG